MPVIKTLFEYAQAYAAGAAIEIQDAAGQWHTSRLDDDTPLSIITDGISEGRLRIAPEIEEAPAHS